MNLKVEKIIDRVKQQDLGWAEDKMVITIFEHSLRKILEKLFEED